MTCSLHFVSLGQTLLYGRKYIQYYSQIPVQRPPLLARMPTAVFACQCRRRRFTLFSHRRACGTWYGKRHRLSVKGSRRAGCDAPCGEFGDSTSKGHNIGGTHQAVSAVVGEEGHPRNLARSSCCGHFQYARDTYGLEFTARLRKQYAECLCSGGWWGIRWSQF